MSTQPAQPALEQLDRTPDWTVQSVFDPDGGGHDFAYTIGLHEHGLPELHVWARPDRGEDPGLDWGLSIRDRTAVLNDIAWWLIDGTVEVGSEWEAEFDCGEARAHFRVDPPGDRDHLEAFGIAADAAVLPVTWALTRPHVGPLTGLGADAVAMGRSDFADAVAAAGGPVRGPGAWNVPDVPDFSVEQEFGPLTAVVRARAAQIIAADVSTWNALLRVTASVDMDSSLTFPTGMARAAARRVGRVACLDHLDAEVGRLLTWLRDDPTRARHWGEVMDSLFGPMTPEQRAAVSGQHEGLVRDSVLTVLAVEAVADVIDVEWLTAARGPWLRALNPLGFPGPAWMAAPAVQRAVLDLMTPLAVEDLGAIADRHLAALAVDASGADAYAAVFHRLDAWASTSPAGCPWRQVLARVPVFDAFVTSLLTTDDGTLGPVLALHEWASCVTAALTFRPRLSAQEVAAFSLPFRDVLGDLEGLLNDPVDVG